MLKNNIVLKGVLIFIISLSFFSLHSIAQESNLNDNKLNIGIQLRPRLEYREGAFRPLNDGEKPAALISERARLTFDYTYKDLLSVKVSPQSVGIWGQENMVQGAETGGSHFSLFEAWAKLKLSNHWNVQFGRQVISLDDERFFGALDWAQGGRAHDAVSVHFQKDKFKVSGFFGFNQNYKSLYGNNLSNPTGNFYATNDAYPYKWMQTVWASMPVGKTNSLTFLLNNVGLQNFTLPTRDSTIYFMQSLGTNFFFKQKKVNGNLSAFYQLGDNSSGTTTQAYLLAVYGGYQIHKKWNVGIGSDWLSGNDVGSGQSKNKAFNPLFHTGHKFYGNMDYYYSGSGHKNAGLSDSYLKVNGKTSSTTNINIVLHQFMSTGEIYDGVKKYNQNLGQEVDLSVSHQINKFANLTAGYSFYLTTSTINFLKSVPDARDYQQWAWVAINITPAFFINNH